MRHLLLSLLACLAVATTACETTKPAPATKCCAAAAAAAAAAAKCECCGHDCRCQTCSCK